MDYAFEYVISHGGICSEEDYPYTAKDGQCKDDQCKSQTTIKGYKDIAAKDGKGLLAAIAEHPVSVAIEADSYVFQYYTSGVLDSDACGVYLNHGVAAVGYGVEDGKKYILVRNSWGPSWGDQGYVKIAHTDEGSGVCGINVNASYPVA